MFATHALSLVLAIVFALQVAAGVRPSIAGAGLVKPLVAEGQWWRLVTACFLHGNVVHLVSNVAGLQIFGRIVEARASSTHVLVVYLISGLAASLCSWSLSPATSIGASGAVLGLVGCAFVIGYRDARNDRRDLLVHAGKALVITGIIGAVLYRVIDNAAHAGGALAGAAAGLLCVRHAVVRPLPTWVGWLSVVGLVAAGVTAGAMVVNSRVLQRPPLVTQVTDPAPVAEARVTLTLPPGRAGVEYAITNTGSRSFTAWEVGFYTDNGARRVGGLAGDVCRPVEERPGWMRPRQTHVELFQPLGGERRRTLSARVDVVLIDGGGFSGSRARYDAMLNGRRHRLEELTAIRAALTAAAAMAPLDAVLYLTQQIDVRAAVSEHNREPLIISELLAARRGAELHAERFATILQRLTDQAQRNAELLRLCDVR